MKTALERQREAERDFLRQLRLPEIDRMKLSELLQSVLATAAHLSLEPTASNHRTFVEKHPIFFRQLAMTVVDARRAGSSPNNIYWLVRERAATFELKLSEDPFQPVAA